MAWIRVEKWNSLMRRQCLNVVGKKCTWDIIEVAFLGLSTFNFM